jgi:cell division GTPase FtsZ
MIFYCLGGYSNFNVADSFIKILKQQNRIFKLIVQFPASFEGNRRNKQAVFVANQLSKLSIFRCLHIDQLRKDLGKTTLGDLFLEAVKTMYELSIII